MRVSEHRGRFHVTVFTTPLPPRVGPVDVSVLVQDEATGEPLNDARVVIQSTSNLSPNRTIIAGATLGAGTNSLFFSAVVDFPTSGTWHVLVRVERAEERAEVVFEMAIEEPPPGWFKFAGWIAWPAAVIILYAMHRLLVARKEREQNADRVTS